MTAPNHQPSRGSHDSLDEIERRARQLGLVTTRRIVTGTPDPAIRRHVDSDGSIVLSISTGVHSEEVVATVAREHASAAAIEAALGWSLTDILTASDQRATIDDFCNKLAQAYEETYVLFRAMRLLASSDSPRSMLESVCRDFHATLPFDWIALQFSTSPRIVAELRGQMISAGALPLPESEMSALTVAKTESLVGDSWSHVLSPSEDPLAAAVSSEVVLEPVTHDDLVIGILLAGGKHGVDSLIASPEIQFLDAAADFIGTFHENIARLDEQRTTALATLRALVAAIDAKDRYTCGHSERVAAVAALIAQAMGLSPVMCERIRLSGLVHDVGKIGVSEAILCKPGRPTDDEFDAIRRHPQIGFDILRGVTGFEDLLPGVLHHHERWDGGGYPHKLVAEQIPQMARIIGVADAFDAMSSTRSYRPALARSRVLDEIKKGIGTQFDPEAAAAFFQIDLAPYDELLAKHAAQGEWADPLRRAA